MVVDDVTKRHGGQQLIQADSQVIPLKLQRELLYTPVRKPTTWELDNLPRVMLTADQPWDPSTISDDLMARLCTQMMMMFWIMTCKPLCSKLARILRLVTI